MKPTTVTNAAAKRVWLKCNFPMFLDFVIFFYLYFTVVLLSESALRRAYDDAVAYRAAQPTIPPGVHGRYYMPPGPPPSPWNVYGATLHYIGFVNAAARIGWLPDLVIMLGWGAMTLIALHTAALGDPGEIPADYQAPEWARPQSRVAATNATADVGGVAITCAPTAIAKSQYRAAHTKEVADPYYCRDCNHDRPIRSHHCRYCQICVARFDHHCDWIDNCVGQRNHKCFLLFIFYISCCIFHFLSMMWRYFANRSSSPISFVTVWQISHLIGLIFYAFIVVPCALFAAFFLVNTVWQLLRDETTIESMHPARYGKAKAALGLRWLQAMKLVMGPKVWMWWWPDLQPLWLPSHPSPVAMATGGKHVAISVV